MTNENDLIDRLRTEADLCRNETATDIADLLDEAAREIGNLHRAIWCAEVNCSDGIQAGIHLGAAEWRATLETVDRDLSAAIAHYGTPFDSRESLPPNARNEPPQL